ncbi:MAG: ABC transporter substrate-binding protein [Acidobacteria bacterium]|nr:ABC transporter substrate-binding protein [Acidobacteriota bacterium]
MSAPIPRHFSVWLVAVVALGALSADCGRRPRAEPERPVVLRIGIPLPTTSGQMLGVNEIASVITNEGLVRTLRDGRHASALADGWEWIAADVLRIHLRRDARFQDGDKVTAGRAKASLDRSRHDSVQSQLYPTLRDIAAIEVEAGDWIRVRCARPTAFLLDDLEVPIRKWDTRGQPIGAGPYLTEETRRDGMILRASRHYFRGHPQIARIHLKTYRSLRTAWAGMMRGDIDLLYEVPSDTREFVEQESSVALFSFLRPYVYTLVLNHTRPMLRDPAVRAALNYGIDRQALIDRVLHGRGKAATGPVWPLHWATRRDAPGFAFDPFRANALLARTNGAPMELTGSADRMPARLRFACVIPAGVSPHEELAIALQKQFFDLGVDMRVEPLPIPAFLERLSSGEYDAALIDLNGGPGLVRLYLFWHSQGYWKTGYSAADEAIDTMRSAPDDNALVQAVSKGQRVLTDDPPAVFLAWPETTRAVSRRFEVPDVDGDLIKGIWEWTLRP